MGLAPRDRQGIAGGVLTAARNVGMVLGVGLAGAVFSTALSARGGTGDLLSLTHAVSLSLLGAMGVAAAGCVTSLIR